jgi:hypothetical protein
MPGIIKGIAGFAVKITGFLAGIALVLALSIAAFSSLVIYGWKPTLIVSTVVVLAMVALVSIVAGKYEPAPRPVLTDEERRR